MTEAGASIAAVDGDRAALVRASWVVVGIAVALALLSYTDVPPKVFNAVREVLQGMGAPDLLASSIAVGFSRFTGPAVLPVTVAAAGVAIAARPARPDGPPLRLRLALPIALLALWSLGHPLLWNLIFVELPMGRSLRLAYGPFGQAALGAVDVVVQAVLLGAVLRSRLARTVLLALGLLFVSLALVETVGALRGWWASRVIATATQPILCAAIVGQGLARRAAAIARLDRCPACGYDLQGRTSTSPCPECGWCRGAGEARSGA